VMLTLVYDTETSGFIDKRAPATSPSQPHLVQLGMVLYDEQEIERATVDLIVKPPEGVTIPEGAAKAHGITTEMANRYGVSLELAVAVFVNLRRLASIMVGHNEEFDRIVMDAAIHRTGRKPSHPGPGIYGCSMRESEQLVKLPPTPKMIAAGLGNKFKAPSLTEAHLFFFGATFEGAHSAIADCRACGRVWFELKRRQANG
jgi:DNA polymerase-3 subunit epsilon